MPKAKYNVQFKNQVMRQKSYIRVFLEEEISFLLSPTAESMRDIEFSDIYVHSGSNGYEDALRQYLIPTRQDRVLFLTGLTGCGKTCLLRYVFQDPKITRIEKSLVIMFSFNNKHLAHDPIQGIFNYFVNTIKAAYDYISNQYQIPIDDFCEYIKDIRPDLLQFTAEGKQASNAERVQGLSKKSPLEYHLLRLKYYLNSTSSDINNVVLLVDNIESVGAKRELIPINQALAIMACLENGSTNKQRKWCANLIISCRHYVYRMLKTRGLDVQFSEESSITSQTIESYSIDNELHIDKSASIANIICKRYNALIKKESARSTNWTTAMEVILLMISDIDSSVGDFIVNLNISNLRKALECFRKLVFNRRWIQRDTETPGATIGAFHIDTIKMFKLTPVNMIRAIGMEEGNIYNSQDSIIPNLLYNDTIGNLDFMILLALKCFIERCNQRESSWRHDIKISDIYDRVMRVIPSGQMQFFKQAVAHLIEKRLLLRGSRQAQDDGIDMTPEVAKNVEYVYVSEAARQLWAMLGKSSILFELYVDDIWIENPVRREPKKQIRMFDDDNFGECLLYLRHLVNIEKRIKQEAHNNGLMDRYRQVFGNNHITWHLYLGLNSSLNAYYRDGKPEGFSEALRDIAMEIGKSLV